MRRAAMRRVEGIDGLSPGLFRRPVATLGVFDGVHRGHRAVLDATAALARERGGQVVAVTFDIHPRVLVSGAGPAILTSLPHRLLLLERAGAAATVVLRFDRDLRERSAESFLEEILVDRVGIAGLVLGPDTHFGKDRRGNPDLARRVLEPRGLPVRAVGRVAGAHGPVSSTAIREALGAGDLDRAAEMLGRPPSLLGTVVRGEGRGRSLGIPTANLDVAREMLPPRGVYAGRAADADGSWPGGSPPPCLVNIGGRPTFHPDGGAADSVEAWIPGFDGDLYGKTLEVSLLAHLREEERFASAAELRAQIDRDHVAMVEWMRRSSG